MRVDFGRDYMNAGESGAVVELRAELPRALLTAALYEVCDEDPAAFADDEIAQLVANTIVFEGLMSYCERADQVFSQYRDGKLSADDTAWWARCASRIETVFFGAVAAVVEQAHAGVTS